MRRAVVLLGFAIAACSGSSPADRPDAGSSVTSASGVIHGTAVHATSSYANARADFGIGLPGVELYVDTGADTCTARFPATKNATNFIIDIIGAQLAVGDYTVIDAGPGAGVTAPQQGQADAVFNTTDATCTEGTEDVATSGTVTLTESDATHIAGTFDITFGDGHVSGAFDAPICAPSATPTYSLTCN